MRLTDAARSHDPPRAAGSERPRPPSGTARGKSQHALARHACTPFLRTPVYILWGHMGTGWAHQCNPPKPSPMQWCDSSHVQPSPANSAPAINTTGQTTTGFLLVFMLRATPGHLHAVPGQERPGRRRCAGDARALNFNGRRGPLRERPSYDTCTPDSTLQTSLQCCNVKYLRVDPLKPSSPHFCSSRGALAVARGLAGRAIG